ncbi:hypothetical protein [Actinomyces sp.]|uniref:hypothetical protein n=1 Tax=Actinomyces sp. TaxID=29317 RepID=UPI00290ADC8B|nr:hypothetical protein [Actinomyces sp.]MDU6757751.1 hypothetical protein [Actinomyces sp.]
MIKITDTFTEVEQTTSRIFNDLEDIEDWIDMLSKRDAQKVRRRIGRARSQVIEVIDIFEEGLPND